MTKNKCLLLLAGSPGTGKTYLLNLLKIRYPKLISLTPDDLKILYAERLGFNDLKEKAALEKNYVWPNYYQQLEMAMEKATPLIASEYPFSDKQKNPLNQLAQTYDYQLITLRLNADFETLWQRRYQRDRELDRHLSFIMTSYHQGDRLDDRTKADNHISKEEFYQIITKRKYAEFQLGKLYEVDVTNYSSVDYDYLLAELDKELGKLPDQPHK